MALSGVLFIAATNGGAWASDRRSSPAVSPNGPAACRNLPVSEALINPTSCVITGPRSMLVAGTAPDSPTDGMAVTVEGQQTRAAAVPGSGRLTIHSVTGGSACVISARGETINLELVSMRLARGLSACSGPAPLPNPPPQAERESALQSAAPAPASSYYVYWSFLGQCGPTATTGCPLYVDGADEPAPAGGALVVLDFGAPCYADSQAGPVYGAQLFLNSICTTDDQLVALAQAFLRGYESTHGAGTPRAIIALGTSNAVTGANAAPLDSPAMQDSGKAWFENLVQPFAAAVTGPAPIVTWGASDIEQSSNASVWYGPNESTAWVNGYGAAAAASLGPKHCSGNDPYRLADYGNDVLTGGWTQPAIFQVAWGAPADCAVPEIYFSANATSWQQTSRWGVANGKGPIPFTGPMTLGGEGGTLSARDSWSALANATGQSPPYLTDIGSLFSSPPDPPQNLSALAGDQSATAWWSPSTSDGGSPVQDYVVTAYAGGTPGPSTTVRGLPPPTTATVQGLTNGTVYTIVVAATNSAGTGSGSQPSNQVVPGPGRYHPLNPTRILDTRDGTGGFHAPLGPQSQLRLQATGAGPLPASGVAAVVLNVTVTNTTAASYLTVSPADVPRPNASNLNWTNGTTVPNLVEVLVGPSGGVSFFNAAGNVDVIADVEGYVGLANETPASDGWYAPVTPARVVDTRDGTGTGGAKQPIAGGQTIQVVVGQAGQEAVVLNVTATSPTSPSYLTVWPDGAPQPVVSNLNFAPGQTIANRVMVKVGANGKVDIFNAAGSVHVVADLNGSFTDGSIPTSGSRFQGIAPTRIVDSRVGTGGPAAPLGGGSSRVITVAGANGIPASATAVVANVTVTDTTAASYLTAWPDLETRPNASDLNWVTGRTVPNLVIVKLDSNGKLDIYNAAGSTDLIIDVVGYYR